MKRPLRDKPGATLDDFLAIPEEDRFHELIDGEVTPKASPSGEHGHAQRKLGAVLDAFERRPGGHGPGGWWFGVEVEVALPSQPARVVRPDVLGWRRDRHPAMPRGTPVSAKPDWICEILSSNRRRDLVLKKHVYHQANIDHYWLLDPIEETLTVYRWHQEGYLELLASERGDRVRAEPFGAIEIAVGGLFGDEDEEA